MANLETRNSTGSVTETVGSVGGQVLGVLAGLELAEAAGTVVGKIATVLGGWFVGGFVGKKAGQALS